MLGGGFGRRLPFTFDYVDLARARRQGDVARAGEDDLDARERHPARLLPRRGDVASRRRAGRERRAARRALELHRRRQRRGGVHAVRDRREERRREEGRASDPARASGGRCSTRSTASSRSRSSTRWRTPPARIRSSSGAGCSATSRASRRRSRRRRRCPAGARRSRRAKGAASPSARASAPSSAEVVHVAVSPEGPLKVLNVYAAVDCGDVVNLDSATAQVEGGIIFALSAALLSEITIANGRVVREELPRLPDDPHRRRAERRPRRSSAPMRRSAGSASRACRRWRRRWRTRSTPRPAFACASCRSRRRR